MKKLFFNLGVVFALCILTAQVKLYVVNSSVEVFDESKKGYLAIIIDDFGYTGDGTEEMLALDIPITAAVMPFSKNTKEDLEKIKASGKEVMVHMPMESLTGKKEWVGDKGIFMNMSDEDIKKTTKEALEIIDGAVGVNNHMGSAITTNEDELKSVFEVLGEKGLFFVDSVTVGGTVSEKIGEETGVEVYKRDVFLDSTDDVEKIKENVLKAAEAAIKNGKAIAIGHVGPEGGEVTARALKETYEKLKEMGVEVVSISEYIKIEDND